MLPRPSDCTGCPLHDQGIAIGWSNIEGNGSLGVLVVPEALGKHEATDGLPLRPHAPSGSVFERTIRRSNRLPGPDGQTGDLPYISREGFTIANICRCQPGHANLLEHMPYEQGAIEHCQRHFARVVEQARPKVMLALGNVALKTLTGFAGKKRQVTNVRGFALNGCRYPIPVVSSYHPAFLARDKQHLMGVLRNDLRFAVRLAARGGRIQRPVKRYIIYPNISEAEEWLRFARLHPELPICYDIETMESMTGVDENDLRGMADGSTMVMKAREEYVEREAKEGEEEEGEETEPEPEVESIVHHTLITQIQFSIHGDGDAIVVPWNPTFAGWALKVLALPNMKFGWNNRGFDDPILRTYGAKLNGDVVDAQWLFHHIQPDLPRGLQYATSFHFPMAEPWKHTSNDDPGNYGGDDVRYLREFGPAMMDHAKTWGIYEGWHRHVHQLLPILGRAEELGIPVDDGKRLALGEHVDRLRAEVDVELQGRFPDELRNCEPKQGYANPKIAEKRQAAGGLEPGERWARRTFMVEPPKPKKVRAKKGKKGEEGQAELDFGAAPETTDVVVGVGAPAGPPAELVPEERWCRLQPFLPNSSKQIIAYIKWQRAKEIEEKVAAYRAMPRHAQASDVELRLKAEGNALWKVPKTLRGDKETTIKKELQRLGARVKDTFFDLVVEHREYGKVKGTYVEGCAPAADGRIHPHFEPSPATGQLASKRPASMTFPKPGGHETAAEARRTDLALRCRGMVTAPPGYKIICIDKRSFHAMTLGFNARDLEYLRIAEKDIHSFLTANFMWINERAAFLATGLPRNPESWPSVRCDAELIELLKIVKGKWTFIRDKKAKPTGLGIALGLGDKKCYDMNKRDELNPRGFETIAEVTKFKDVLRGLFPKIFQFQDDIREQIHRLGYHVSRHGYVRYFFDVYHNVLKNGRWGREAGRDSEAAIAFPVQNDAHGMIKEEVLELERMGKLGEWGFCNIIHDELKFCCADRLVEECVHVGAEVMSKPSRVLIDPLVAPGGLRVGVEASVGQNWAPKGPGNEDGLEKVLAT